MAEETGETLIGRGWKKVRGSVEKASATATIEGVTKRVAELDARNHIAEDLGVAEAERKQFEALLAMNLLDRESRPGDMAGDQITETIQDMPVLGVPLRLGEKAKEGDRKALEAMRADWEKTTDQNSQLRKPGVQQVCGLLASIYIQSRIGHNKDYQQRFSEAYNQRKEYIKGVFSRG
jgi:hypothetical protein